ncbi:tannase and feruloyl esterase family protein [Aspergillus saccharolyticus JOP 1030-1]|uniref:Carboxylic ester hydrolase n=1 Tax=Aspergillus saccharolyticus JOP 1030-1 TaxID=1450539 RepID=A0A319AIK2_9EURO|nr:tannase and feruloyl esterase family protein [Aspergillus saccharolyticus JOP 1030-1]PYH46472.1 tannase and feruloyl esterase family protein [Aspergillus saccharolyticus JOP 1030-1]
MVSSAFVLAVAALVATVQAATLDDVCTSAYVKAVLPLNVLTGITIDSSSVVVSATKNYSSSAGDFFGAATFDYCAVQLAYSHNSLTDDQVLLMFWLPAPDDFQNRYLSTGGGGMAINSGNQSLPGGVMYGAVTGATDGGFGSFDLDEDDVFLAANGTIDYEALYMFGYKAHHEMSVIGKQFTRNFFNMTESMKLYAYYQACSEGGREGWSQIQRYDDWDGAIVGAPAFRYAHQQVQHLWSDMVMKNLDYFPPPCELTKILNLTIAACDPLDGLTDGVVSRTDLCKLHYDMDQAIGETYYCAAESGSSGFGKRQSTTPAQSGKVTAKGVAVAKAIIAGMKDSQGQQVYLSYQPSATWGDAGTTYNSTSGTWYASASGIGGDWVDRFLELIDSDELSLDVLTEDKLKAWIYEGWQRYDSVLQTTWPDLSVYHGAGGKILHVHGESDYSVPTASSVRYWESVRSVMYPDLSYTAGAAALNDWYRLYLIPGAGHCSPSTDQTNGPFPQTTLEVLIEWVEKDVKPNTLPATVLQGSEKGKKWELCAWPLRPMWKDNGKTFECIYDQASIDTWHWDLNAWDLPVY